MHGVLGPNGAGKTTAVRILATLLEADEGSARVAGHDVAREPARVRELIGLTGQYASVDELLTGRQNLELIGTLLDLAPQGLARPRAGTAGLVRPQPTPPTGRRKHLLRRHAPPPGPRRQPRRPAERGLPRRADDRPRSRQARGHVGRRARPRRRRLDGAADHAVPRGGRRAGRRDHGHRPRPRDRPRHAGRAQARRRRPDPDRPARRPAAPGGDRRDHRRHRRRAARLADPQHGQRAGQPATRSSPRRSRGWPRPASPSPSSRCTCPAWTRSSSASPGARPPPKNAWRCWYDPLRPPQLRAGQAQPDRRRPQPGGADRRHAAADHLHRAVHVRLRRRDRARLPARLPAVPAARASSPRRSPSAASRSA